MGKKALGLIEDQWPCWGVPSLVFLLLVLRMSFLVEGSTESLAEFVGGDTEPLLCYQNGSDFTGKYGSKVSHMTTPLQPFSQPPSGDANRETMLFASSITAVLRLLFVVLWGLRLPALGLLVVAS